MRFSFVKQVREVTEEGRIGYLFIAAAKAAVVGPELTLYIDLMNPAEIGAFRALKCLDFIRAVLQVEPGETC
jgi:hypothetical protein